MQLSCHDRVDGRQLLAGGKTANVEVLNIKSMQYVEVY